MDTYQVVIDADAVFRQNLDKILTNESFLSLSKSKKSLIIKSNQYDLKNKKKLNHMDKPLF